MALNVGNFPIRTRAKEGLAENSTMPHFVDEPRFDEELHEIEPDPMRADEDIGEARRWLFLNPVSGEQVYEKSDMRRISINEHSPDKPSLAIYYTYTEGKNSIYFHHIEIVSDDRP